MIQMKILFAMLISALWVVGIYEGNCTAAVMLSAVPIITGLEIVIAAITWQIHKRRTSLGRGERQDG